MNNFSNKNIDFLIKNIYKSPKDIKKIKGLILDFSFKLMDKGLFWKELYSSMKNTFLLIETNGIIMTNIYRNKNISNTIKNFEINYHIDLFKKSEKKSIKDYHFSKVYMILEKLVIKIVRKENMWMCDEDLCSAWFLWVFKAIEWNFDPLQADFSTYAYMKIRKEIQDAKSLDNYMHYIPNIHNYYYNTYRKIFKEIMKHDAFDLNENVIEQTYKKLSQNNAWVTKVLLTDIVNNKLVVHLSLDDNINSDDDSEDITMVENIETEIWLEEMNIEIDNSILRDHIKKFLGNYTDFEKSIIERKFWIDLGWENSYPVYTIKVTRDWVEWQKEMIAIRSSDAIKRVESLWYKVLSSKHEVTESMRTETYVWSSMKKLREFFEIKKLTYTTEMSLRKNENKIITQLTSYFKNIYNAKWVENPYINLVTA
jgi:hypothetical protein